MNKKILLTVGIPAYNVELYLEETVSSIATSKFSNQLEILIVNDGSTDHTSDIAQTIANKYSCVKVINKQNGGHGSTINTAIKNANGKYFRLLDGDDWFDTHEFDLYLEKLQNETADIVFTDLVECFLKSNLYQPVTYYSHLPAFRQLNFDSTEFPEWGPMLPTTTIKTNLLKKFNLQLDEKCFYVDQEYNLACYLSSQTFVYYPFMVYNYRLEREGQSMEKSSLIRNVYSHEKVCIRLLLEYKKHLPVMSELRKKYLSTRVIIPMCHMQYEIITNYCKSRTAFLSFDKKLKSFKTFYNDPNIAGNVTRFYRKTHALFVPFDHIIKKLALKKDVILSKLPQGRSLKIIVILLSIIYIIAAIFLTLHFSLNPYIISLISLSLFYMFITNLCRISNYLILSLLLSIILLIDYKYFPLLISFYALILLYMSLLNLKKFKISKLMLIKNLKMFIKLLLSAIIPILILAINLIVH